MNYLIRSQIELENTILPTQRLLRDSILNRYFNDLSVVSRKVSNHWRLYVSHPDYFGFYVDPYVRNHLKFLGIHSIFGISSFHRFMKNFFLCLNDAWVILYWTKLLQTKNNGINIIHANPYRSFGIPFVFEEKNLYHSIFDQTPLNINDLETIKSIVNKGIITASSFMTFFLHTTQTVPTVVHISSEQKQKNLNTIVKSHSLDSLIQPGKRRISLKEKDTHQCENLVPFFSYENLEEVAQTVDLNLPTFFHINLSFFSNNYDRQDGKSALLNHSEKEKTFRKIDTFFQSRWFKKTLEKKVHYSFSLAPGFYPSVWWKESLYKISTYFHDS